MKYNNNLFRKPQPSENDMLDDAMTSAIAKTSERVEQQRRLTYSQSKRSTTDDCTEPIILPKQILWCPNNDGAAKQWLLTEELPWWFFASFINYCAYAVNGHARSPRVRRCYTPSQRHLMARLRKFPSVDDELIEESKWFLARPAQNEWYKRGRVDITELSKF